MNHLTLSLCARTEQRRDKQSESIDSWARKCSAAGREQMQGLTRMQRARADAPPVSINEIARHQLDDVGLDGSSSTVLRSSSLSAPVRHSSSPAASTPHRAEPLGARLATAPLIAARCAAPTPPLLIAAPLLLCSSTISPLLQAPSKNLYVLQEQCRGGLLFLFLLFFFPICSFAPSLVFVFVLFFVFVRSLTTTRKTGPFRFALPQAFE